jgi:ribosomal protein S27AE
MHNILGPNGAGQSVPQPKVQIDLSTSTPMVCPNCGYDVFMGAVKIRKISKLITGTPQDMILPIDVMVCGGCGEVNQELLPEQIRNLENGGN